VPAEGDLAISIYVPGMVTGAGIHYLAQQTSYVGTGNLTASPAITNPRTLDSWVFLAGVDVSAPLSAAAVAVFGDSRVDGDGSTADTNHRLPDALARRLLKQGLPLGVVNAGIIGNRLLHDSPPKAVELGVNGLSRFDRDVLDHPGVKFVIVLSGIVDIGLPGTRYATLAETVSVDDLIVGMKQLIERAHERGVRIFAATQTPMAGATSIPGIFSPEKDAKRKALNQWIRSSHAFDGVIDFEPVVAAAADPDRISPALDSGDHIHPNDVGYEALARAIDLGLFR
jgi:lysophospholipase L1-like esterase